MEPWLTNRNISISIFHGKSKLWNIPDFIYHDNYIHVIHK